MRKLLCGLANQQNFSSALKRARGAWPRFGPGLAVVLALGCWATAAVTAAEPVLRRESVLGFQPDSGFLAAGGIQYFFAIQTPKGEKVLSPESNEAEWDKAFRAMLALDQEGAWSGRGDTSYGVVLTRTLYRVEKPVAFFSKQRLLDAGFMSRVVPSMKLTQVGEGSFEVASAVLEGMPSYAFSLTHLPGADLPDQLAALAGFAGRKEKPNAILLQHNANFGRIMNVRTSHSSDVATFYRPDGEAATLIDSFAISFIYNLPPFDGAETMLEETIRQTGEIVLNLRELGE